MNWSFGTGFRCVACIFLIQAIRCFVHDGNGPRSALKPHRYCCLQQYFDIAFLLKQPVGLPWTNWFSKDVNHIMNCSRTLPRFRFEDPLYANPSGLFNPAGAFSPSHGWIVTFRWDKCGYGVCGVLKTDSKVDSPLNLPVVPLAASNRSLRSVLTLSGMCAGDCCLSWPCHQEP
jgi:hypothetical protein